MTGDEVMRVAGFHRLAEQEALAIGAAQLFEPVAHLFVLSIDGGDRYRK